VIFKCKVDLYFYLYLAARLHLTTKLQSIFKSFLKAVSEHLNKEVYEILWREIEILLTIDKIKNYNVKTKCSYVHMADKKFSCCYV